METQNYSCKKCGLTVTSVCSKCDRVVDVKVLDNGCIVQQTKCGDCANVPVIKDVCAQQKFKNINFFFDIWSFYQSN